MLHCNREVGLPLETDFLDKRRTVQDIGVTVVVMEIRLSEKALEKVECNLQTVGNGLRLTLLMKPIYMILLIYHG